MPLTAKQQEYLMNAHHRWNVKTGATGSGKSFVDFTTVIPKRLERLRGEGLSVLIGNTQGTLERNILEPMRSWWPDLVSEIHADNTVDIFGHKCYALGADSKKHVARIQGATFEYVYGDEITTWSQDVFEMLKSRLRCDHSHFDGTCNPDNPLHWFKKFLDSDADIYHQTYTIYDNPFLPPSFVKNLEKEYAGTVLFDRFILGKWAASEGALFTTYPVFTNDPRFLYDGVSHVDAAYGGSDSTAFTCGHRIGDRLYLYGRMWHAHVDTVMGVIATEARRLRCAPHYLETNADKGYLAREFRRMGDETRMYQEHQNKFFKIASYLRKWWPNIVFLEGTDRAYIDQIMSYTEGAEHDDAPDSAACVCRLLDRRQ